MDVTSARKASAAQARDAGSIVLLLLVAVFSQFVLLVSVLLPATLYRQVSPISLILCFTR